MKLILKNKKFLTLSIFLVAIILSFIIMLPTVFAQKSDYNQNLEKQTPKNTVVEKSTRSTDVPTEKTTQPNDTADNKIQKSQSITNSDIVKIQGKTVIFENITFNYVNTSADVNGVEAVKYYKSTDGAEIYIDDNTNKVVRISFTGCELPESMPKANNANEVEVVAKKLFAKLCEDYKDYDKTEIYNNSQKNTYTVYFYKTINGYPTTVTSRFQFDENLRISYYYSAPDVFKNIDVSNLVIDEKAIIEQINRIGKEKKGEDFNGVEIISMTLTVKNSKIVMLVDLNELDKEGNPIISTSISRLEFEIG